VALIPGELCLAAVLEDGKWRHFEEELRKQHLVFWGFPEMDGNEWR